MAFDVAGQLDALPHSSGRASRWQMETLLPSLLLDMCLLDRNIVLSGHLVHHSDWYYLIHIY